MDRQVVLHEPAPTEAPQQDEIPADTSNAAEDNAPEDIGPEDNVEHDDTPMADVSGISTSQYTSEFVDIGTPVRPHSPEDESGTP